MEYCEDFEEKNRNLANIFQRIGAEHGYTTVNAEYLSTKDLKVRWQRSYDWIDFRVSDYLDDAPEKVLEGLARNLFERIEGKASEYSPDLKEWVTRKQFSKDKQPIYIDRSPGLLRTPEGKHKDLRESMKRLQESGLIGKLPQVYLSWEDSPAQKMGHCSVLMRVVSVNTMLDKEEVPDFVLDYCLYNELLHIQIGYNPDNDAHEGLHYEKCQEYKMKDEADRWLRTMEVYA